MNVILGLSYCLNTDHQLTVWCYDATLVAKRLLERDPHSHFILSAAHGTWPLERDLKLALLSGIAPDRIHVLEGVTDTFDEIEKAAPVLEKLSAGKLIIVAETWHAKRVPDICKEVIPGVQVEIENFR